MKIDIMQGDSLTVLRTLPTESVHCCVTSPPYWGLRDYGTAKWEGGSQDCNHSESSPSRTAASVASSTLGGGKSCVHRSHQFKGNCLRCGAVRIDMQGGLEPTLGEHLAWLVEVFGEVRRVLRRDGTLWLNYGDAYASAPNGRSAADTKAAGNDDRTFRDKPISTVGGTLKPKDRMLLPARIAIALQDDGWWVRDEIIWHKPNPMPSSVKDRTTPAHEMIYMLSKLPRYWFDAEAYAEPIAEASKKRYAQKGINEQKGGPRQDAWENGEAGQAKSRRPNEIVQALAKKVHDNRITVQEGWAAMAADATTRNRRSVWRVPTKPCPEAHFATFPPDLIEPCILAGCPWGGTVLDPFGGAGTTGLVAEKNGRNAILIELNPEYINIAKRRLGISAAMPWEVAAVDFPWAAP